MTLVAVQPFHLWFNPDFRITGFGAGLIDAANEKHAVIFQAPNDGDIDRVCFRTGTVTTGATVDVRLETLNASGLPSGTLFGTNTNASQVIANADDNTWFEVTLTAAAAVQQGDWLALVVANPGASFGNMQIARGNNGTGEGMPVTPTLLYTTSWARSTEAGIGAVRYSDGSYPFVAGLYPFSAVTSSNYQSASSPDERGNKITVPFACKVIGLWVSSTFRLGDATFFLYDDADTVLTSLVIDGDTAVGHAGTAGDMNKHLFTDEVTLAAGDVVRLTRRATSATDTNSIHFTIPSGLMEAAPGGGNMVLTTRTDAGAWTDTSTGVAHIGLILSALDDGAGGGGGTTQGNLGSVLRGVAH